MRGYIEINGRRIGSGYPVYVVAEISSNHLQDFDKAVRLIKAAKDAGADAVKIQTFTPDTLTISSDREYFRIKGGTPWDGNTLYDLYRKSYMPWEWHPKLKLIANKAGIDLFSTAYDPSSVEFLEEMANPAYKVSSFEIVDIPLIKRIAGTGKPIIISTGMATLAEIEEAIKAAKGAGAKQIALLKCASAYPAPPEDMNLLTIPDMIKKFHIPVGLSDHTLGIAVPAAAAALGASIVEKHLTLSRDIPAPDSAFSLEPNEFKAMVGAIRIVEKSLGKVRYRCSPGEVKSKLFRRSLFVVKDVKKGEKLTEDNVRSIRPSYGLPPKYLKDVSGRRAAKDIERGTPLIWDLIA